MSETGLVQIIEGALLAAGKPLTVAQLGELFEDNERPDNSAIREALAEVTARCEGRGFELQEVASGFRFQVRQSLSPWVARLWHERPQKYSRALLETLSLIAYRQPITRGEIEEIRGVAVSSNIIKTLHEREWIRVVGHRDVPGRPAMYATTRQFLDYFNLKTLDQLPALAEIRDLETLNAELGFSDAVAGTANSEEGAAADSPEGAGESGPGLTLVGGTEHVATGSPMTGSPMTGSPMTASPMTGSTEEPPETEQAPTAEQEVEQEAGQADAAGDAMNLAVTAAGLMDAEEAGSSPEEGEPAGGEEDPARAEPDTRP